MHTMHTLLAPISTMVGNFQQWLNQANPGDTFTTFKSNFYGTYDQPNFITMHEYLKETDQSFMQECTTMLNELDNLPDDATLNVMKQFNAKWSALFTALQQTIPHQERPCLMLHNDNMMAQNLKNSLAIRNTLEFLNILDKLILEMINFILHSGHASPPVVLHHPIQVTTPHHTLVIVDHPSEPLIVALQNMAETHGLKNSLASLCQHLILYFEASETIRALVRLNPRISIETIFLGRRFHAITDHDRQQLKAAFWHNSYAIPERAMIKPLPCAPSLDCAITDLLNAFKTHWLSRLSDVLDNITVSMAASFIQLGMRDIAMESKFLFGTLQSVVLAHQLVNGASLAKYLDTLYPSMIKHNVHDTLLSISAHWIHQEITMHQKTDIETIVWKRVTPSDTLSKHSVKTAIGSEHLKEMDQNCDMQHVTTTLLMAFNHIDWKIFQQQVQCAAVCLPQDMILSRVFAHAIKTLNITKQLIMLQKRLLSEEPMVMDQSFKIVM
jgi:hypothetical protein